MSMDKMSSSFSLISHPDRTLEAHVGSCDDISKIITCIRCIHCSPDRLPDILFGQSVVYLFAMEYLPGVDTICCKPLFDPARR